MTQNNKSKDYSGSLKTLPENVLLQGFRDIIGSYGIQLDDYNSRKLMYHILISIGFFFFHYPDTCIHLEKVRLYRNTHKRNSFVMDIDPQIYYDKDINMQWLYDYFIGGIMDYNELNKELEQYALSYIEYTEKTGLLSQKAWRSYNRYRILKKEYEDARKILKVLGITNHCTLRTKAHKLAKKLRKDRAEANKLERQNKKLDNLD